MSTEVKPKPVVQKKMTLDEYCKLFERMCEEQGSEMRRVMSKYHIGMSS